VLPEAFEALSMATAVDVRSLLLDADVNVLNYAASSVET
jgi:hypothetical protein